LVSLTPLTGMRSLSLIEKIFQVMEVSFGQLPPREKVVDVRALSARLASFVAAHPSGSAAIVFAIFAKATLSILSPLSEDFLTAGVFVAETDPMTILKGNGPYVLWMLLVRGMYSIWRILPVDHPSVESMVGFWYFIPSLSSNLLIFVLKLPLLVFDVLCGYAIYRLCLTYTGSHSTSFAALGLWLTNPYMTLVTEMFGAYDVIVVFFLLTSVSLFVEGRVLFSGFWLVIASALKPYPILLLPAFLFALLRSGKLKESVRLVSLVGLFGLVATGLLASVSSVVRVMEMFSYYFEKGGVFFQSFVLTSEASEFITMKTSLTFVLLTLYLALMCGLWRANVTSVLDSALALCLIFLVFSFWHPQMFVWVLPFITLEYAVNKTSKIFPISLVLTAFMFEFVHFSFYFASHGHSFMFIPNYTSQLLELSKSIQGLHKSHSAAITANIARSLFSGICIYYLTRIFLRNIDPSRLRTLGAVGRPSRLVES